MTKLKEYILQQVSDQSLTPADAAAFLHELDNGTVSSPDQRIAVIGMACDLSDATNYDEFWDNLMHERDCLGYMPRQYEKYFQIVENPAFAKAMGTKPFNIEKNHFMSRSSYLKNMDEFDAAFFGIPPREARYIEPGQRIFLQTACGAIEDAGYSLEDVRGASIGVYVGKDHNNAEFYKLTTQPDSLATTGSWHGILASRISYLFNFRGPALVIDTACSSGLVSVHEACRALQAGDCSMALAGGVAVGGSPADGTKEEDDIVDALDTVASSDSMVRPFDKKSKGTVFGEGCAVVLLKPLQQAIKDGDPIHAVILASALNNDGASNGITAPNPDAQTDVLCQAWENAKIDPRTISYFECHGTGTLLGDPIEFKALNKALRKYTDEKQAFGFGSVKSNVGHLVAASGVVGLMKVILAMKHNTIPASIHFEEPNPHINFLESALYPVDHAVSCTDTDHPLRVGVSSFGFSGTNVHVVVESAEKNNAIEKNEIAEKKQKQPLLFTLSAKSKWSLQQMVAHLAKMLAQNKSMDLESLSYTLNLGRGHYNYRLIFMSDSIEDVIHKLQTLDMQGIDTSLDGVSYGYYKIVSDRRSDRSEGEYTESEVRDWNQRAMEVVNILNDSVLSSEEAKKIMEAYVHGATIAFEKLYGGKPIARLHLPTYAFEKNSQWADLKDMEGFGQKISLETYHHPLVERLVLRSLDQDVYATTFSIGKHWVLHDHVIMGDNILPGTAYVELGREVCSKYIDGPLELKDLTFMAPLVVRGEEEVEAQIVVKKKEDHVEFMVLTQRDVIDAEDICWVKHVEGKAYPLATEEKGGFDHTVIENDKSLVSAEVKLSELDDHDAAMSFGPHWQNMRRIAISPTYLYADARLDDEFIEELTVFQFHTSMLDAAVNAGIQAKLDGVYLPFSFGSLKLYHPLPQEVFSRAICKNPKAVSDEVYIYDVELVDENNNLLVEIKDYSIKKVHQFNAYEEKSYYQIQWVPEQRTGEKQESLGNILLFGANRVDSEMLRELTDLADRVIQVDSGDTFTKKDVDHFITTPDLEGLRSLFAEEEVQKMDMLLFAETFHPKSEDSSFDVLTKDMEHGIETLFHATKAMMLEKVRGRLDFVLLTDHAYAVSGDETIIKPQNAALTGLGQCITQEYENLKIRSIDVDKETTNEEIIHELCDTSGTPRIALRGERRYVEELGKFERTALFEPVSTDFSKGCVLITGGNGGLGIQVARYMAEKGAKSICLVSRHALPDQSEWNAIIAKNENEMLVAKISALQPLVERGIEIRSVAADVADKEAMKKVVSEMTEEFGSITSVFHLAGVAGDGFIVNKDVQTFRDVVSPKIYGAKVLEDVLDWSTVEVMVLFSSMTALFGGPGQSDYTAANAYLNSFAQYGQKKNKPILVVDWPAWSETGMAVDYAVADADVLFESVDNKAGINYLNDVVTYRLSNVVPGQLNYRVFIEIMDEMPIRMTKSIFKAANRFKKKQTHKAGSRRKLDQSEVLILGKPSEDLTETEKKVAYIYAGVMDLEEIDIYENFNALGGNSMTATEILKVLNEYFDNMLDVSDVFSYPTAFEMAEYIDQNRQGEKEDTEAPEEDINKLLEQLENEEIEVEDMLQIMDQE